MQKKFLKKLTMTILLQATSIFNENKANKNTYGIKNFIFLNIFLSKGIIMNSNSLFETLRKSEIQYAMDTGTHVGKCQAQISGNSHIGMFLENLFLLSKCYYGNSFKSISLMRNQKIRMCINIYRLITMLDSRFSLNQKIPGVNKKEFFVF